MNQNFYSDKPIYVAKRSAFAVINWKILLGFLLALVLVVVSSLLESMLLFKISVGTAAFWLILQTWIIILAKTFTLRVYKDRIVTRNGLIRRTEVQEVNFGLIILGVRESFWGRVFDFGEVEVQCVGRADKIYVGIFDPWGLRSCLQENFVQKSDAQMLVGFDGMGSINSNPVENRFRQPFLGPRNNANPFRGQNPGANARAIAEAVNNNARATRSNNANRR